MASSLVIKAALHDCAAWLNSHSLWPSGLLAISLIALPILGDDFLAYQVALFLIYGVATQGVSLCWGRLGLLPLGHGLFFGLGAYLVGGLMKVAAANPLWWMALLPALAVPTLLAWSVARLVFARNMRTGPYFSLITLAMTMLGFLGVQQWSELTGGFNGMGNIPEPFGLDRFSSLYWLIAGFTLASTWLLGVIVNRPLGVLWRAIAQNEERMQLFGYATDHIKADAYALSALITALAGALFAAHQGIVTPQTMGFVISTEFVIWAAVGGKGSPLGALIGAVLVGYTSAELRDVFSAWEVFIGLLFIAVVRFLPTGLAGLSMRYLPTSIADQRLAVLAPSTTIPVQVPELIFHEVRSSSGGVRILDGLSFRLSGPGIRALIGPNGAGKTSAFNVLTGKLPVDSGAITVASQNVTGQPAWKVARFGVGRKLQVPSVFMDLSVRENLSIALWAGRMHGTAALCESPHRWQTKLLQDLLQKFPDLMDSLESPAGQLSQGHRQALELVMTVVPEPHLLLLDEPCAGLSSAETHHMINVIRFAVERLNAAALLIEHDLSAVAALNSDVYVFHQGALLAQGTLAEIQSNPEVQQVYAGARK